MKRFGIVLLCSVFLLPLARGQGDVSVRDTVPEIKPRFWDSAFSEFRTNQLEMTEEDIIKKIDSLPAFSIYKDNFFITGISLHEIPDQFSPASHHQQVAAQLVPLSDLHPEVVLEHLQAVVAIQR